MSSIHPMAVVDPKAELGENVEIGPFCYIGPDVSVGNGTRLLSHVVLHPYTQIGENCTIHPQAVLGGLPQDTAFEDQPSYVKIGNECTIREGVTIHRGTKPDTDTVIGNQCFLMAFSHVAHNCILADSVTLANAVLLAGYVEVDSNTFMGGGAVIHQFVKIGRCVMIGGNAGVSQDVLPFCMVKSVSPNVLLGLNTVGMKRSGLNPEERKAVKRAYHIVYQEGLTPANAIRKIKDELSGTPAEEYVKFAERSTRGFIMP